MNPSIFINLPVADLSASMAFYTQLGFKNQPMFTDETAACMQYTDTISLMLLTHDKYRQFTQKPIVDAHKNSAALYALQVADTATMNGIADAALQAGGKQAAPPADYGFMQQRSFEDPDGHTWEVFYMDITKFPQKQTTQHAQ